MYLQSSKMADSWSDSAPDTDDEGAALKQPTSAFFRRRAASAAIEQYRRCCEAAGCVPIKYVERSATHAELVMNDHGVGPQGAAALAQSLEDNCTIVRLVLRGNDVGGAGAEHFARTLRDHKYIRAVDLSSNRLASHGCTAFAQLLAAEGCSVAELNLGNNLFLDMDSRAFCQALQVGLPLGAASSSSPCSFFGMQDNTGVLILKLAHNRFGDVSGERFGSMLAVNRVLQVLDLSYNCIRSRGGVALFAGLRGNTTLKQLLLAYNGVSDAGAKALADLLTEGCGLEEVDVQGNNIHDTGLEALAQAVQHANCRLKKLDVSHNFFSQAALGKFLEALLSNTSLTQLSMNGIVFNKANLDLLQRVLENRSANQTGGPERKNE